MAFTKTFTREIKFDHGETLRDMITGFKGVVVGHSDYLTGCDVFLLVPRSKDGKKSDGVWFDEDRLERVKAKKVVLKINKQKPGKDMEAPIK